MKTVSQLGKQYPKLEHVTRIIDGFLAREYPDFFGSRPLHPFSPLKRSKVIHDNLWGTNSFSWRELAIIDSPIFQRLRNIHQTGLAYFVYPCAHHTRFEHSLGVCIMASRVFEALLRQHEVKFRGLVKKIGDRTEFSQIVANWRAELRLAALLHDTGHSLHSHTSEIIYSQIPMLKDAAEELSKFVGISKGEGEVLSFCISRTNALRKFLDRARVKLTKSPEPIEEVDYDNISLLIVGRSKHPLLQFMGDIISSNLDADKLDYLLRDATAAGLPLRYDLERYLYTADIVETKLGDGEGMLQKLYASLRVSVPRLSSTKKYKYPYYESRKLQLPRQGVNTIEQIIICKFMLFSYIYHHKKVRAAEGMLARLIDRRVHKWRIQGKNDTSLIEYFLRLDDHSLGGKIFELNDKDIAQYRRRINQRVLPREVVGLTSNVDHAESAIVSRFMNELLDRQKTKALVAKFEKAMASELRRKWPSLGRTDQTVLATTGAWLDVPKAPKFDKLEELLIETEKITDVFPITSWIQAYISYRYYARVFAFSEHVPKVEAAAKFACREVMGIKDSGFVSSLKRGRT